MHFESDRQKIKIMAPKIKVRNGKSCSSKYKGVTAYGNSGKFRVKISYNKKIIYLGVFQNEDEAGMAYNKKAKELFGEYSFLNEIKV